MSKKTSFTALLGTKEQAPAPDGAPPVSALLHTITGNPDNPRDAGELELDELIQSFKEVGQLQPVLTVSRDVYLRHKPHNADAIGDALYVTLGGNRRLEAARELGWARIDIAVRDDLGDGEGSLDEAVIIENIHRKALTPIREAGFLQGMVERYGSQGQVAKRIGKTQAYISQRLALLKLAPELQQAVDSGELKVKEARQLAAVPAEGQQQAWKDKKGSARVTSAKVSPAVPEPVTTSDTHNPVMTPSQRQAEPTQQPASEAASASGPVVANGSASEQKPAPTLRRPKQPLPEVATVEAMPWGQWQEVEKLAHSWMKPDELRALALSTIAQTGMTPDEYAALGKFVMDTAG